ncbi:helix-turn-helix domain-containing protein [Klebsiella aerogenes]|uniref:helix-turn-helix domain-containing protein n=1 Tax=Klebsiella aerogenes TaxID=548 RepID=UPI002FF53C91
MSGADRKRSPSGSHEIFRAAIVIYFLLFIHSGIPDGNGYTFGQQVSRALKMNITEPSLQTIIHSQSEKLYQKGDSLYGADKTFSGLFVLISGAVRLYRLTEEGDELVTGFCLTGEWCGLPDLSTGRYAGYAQALDTCAVRRLSPVLLETVLADKRSRRDMYALMSDIIRKNKTRYYQISKARADIRFAMFILDLSHRFSQQGYSSHEFRLPMTRADIANYLGLTPETVSREITKLEKRNILHFRSRYITVHDVSVLESFIADK